MACMKRAMFSSLGVTLTKQGGWQRLQRRGGSVFLIYEFIAEVASHQKQPWKLASLKEGYIVIFFKTVCTYNFI